MGERALERRIVTVLFCDVVGFTSLSEALDAEDVVAVQDAYFDVVRETVARHGGMLEKFIGDAAVAIFGVPRVRDDDAVRAVRAGLALAAGVDQLGARLGLDEGDLRLRVGVNTGEVVYGEATAERGPVTGDTVNVAARLQTAAPAGGVLVGEHTALAVEGAIVLEAVGGLDLKGKAAATPAWRAEAEEPEPSRERAMRGIRAPILGREGELSRLRRLVEGLRPGVAARVNVIAPPGVGKTRLVDELAGSIEAVVLRARLRPDMLSPFDGVAQLLAAALADAAEPRGVLLERLSAAGAAPGRAAVVADAALGVLAPGRAGAGEPTDRDAAFAAWLEALDALAAGVPAVWIVEDIHWASGDLLAFLAAAGATTSAAGRLVIATARPAVLDRLFESDTLDLAPLTAASTATLLEALVGGALPEDLVSRVAATADGNPLFVEELLRSWIGSGVLMAGDAGWQLRDNPADVAVPSTVQTIYAAQLDDLPHAAREAVRRASVPGRRFPADALEPLGVDEAVGALEVLRRRALVAGPEADPVFRSIYAFRHALLRDAGYASLARAERAALHARLAGWLEGLDSPQLAEVIGRHYAAAAENAPRLARDVAPGLSLADARAAAARWFEAGAVTALELAAHDTAAALLTRALELTDPAALLDIARRRRRLGEILAQGGDMDEAAAELAQARELAAGLLSQEAAARVEYAAATAALGHVANEQVRFEDARRLAEEALDLLGERDDAETARLLMLRAIGWSHGTDELEGPLRDAQRALELATAVGDKDVELEALLFCASEEAPERAVTDLRAVWDLARTRRRWETAAVARRREAGFLLETDHEAAAVALADTRELAAAQGLRESQAWTWYAWAEHHLLTGNWVAALKAGRSALELAEANAYRRVAIRTWYVLLPIADALSDEQLLHEAHAFSAEARASFPAAPAPWARVMSTAADLRFAAAGLSRTARYVPDEDAAVPAFAWSGLPSFYEAADVLLARWLEDGATGRAADAIGLAAGAVGSSPMYPVAKGVFALFDARLAEACADARAPELADAAVAALRPLEAPAWLARALRLQGGEAKLREADAIEAVLGIRA